MLKVNRDKFFNCARQRFGHLRQSQVDGIEEILSFSEEFFTEKKISPNVARKYIAYILATAHHETGRRFEPVREGFASTDEGAIKAVKSLKRRGVISYDYARPKGPWKKSYFGRGYVQLTHYTNYRKMGRRLGIPLAKQPELALDPKISAKILVQGMYEGLFTGVGLPKYIGPNWANYTRARKIVNGRDKASMIASYANGYEKCISILVQQEPSEDEYLEIPEVIKPEKQEEDNVGTIETNETYGPPTKHPVKSTTLWASLIAFITPVFTIIETVATSNPVLAVATIGVLSGAVLWIIKERLKKFPRLEM